MNCRTAVMGSAAIAVAAMTAGWATGAVHTLAGAMAISNAARTHVAAASPDNQGESLTFTGRRPLCQDTIGPEGLPTRGCVWGPWNREPGQWVPPEKRHSCEKDPHCSPTVHTELENDDPYLDL